MEAQSQPAFGRPTLQDRLLPKLHWAKRILSFWAQWGTFMAEETNKAGTQWAILFIGCTLSAVFAIGVDHWNKTESATSSVAVDAAQIANLTIAITNLREETKQHNELERQITDAKIDKLLQQLADQERHIEVNDQKIDALGPRR